MIERLYAQGGWVAGIVIAIGLLVVMSTVVLIFGGASKLADSWPKIALIAAAQGVFLGPVLERFGRKNNDHEPAPRKQIET